VLCSNLFRLARCYRGHANVRSSITNTCHVFGVRSAKFPVRCRLRRTTITPSPIVRLTIAAGPVVFWPKPTGRRAPVISARRYSRDTAEDASAEMPIDMAPIKTGLVPHFHVDGRRWSQRLNRRNETQIGRDPRVATAARMVSAGGFSDARATVLARVISRNIRLCCSTCHMNFKVSPAISCLRRP